MARIVMHIDMNAFFAAVEQQSNPALRGQPVAVIGSRQRTIILTASYEARRFGVKTGMRLGEARACCPQLRLVTAHNRLYTHVSAQIIAIFRDYTPLVEVFSIDEAFLDVSGSLRLYGSAERIAYLIKSRIKARFGLTCSVGIAPNKLLAKLASEMQKPDGLTWIEAGRVAETLEDVPIGALCGIGRRTQGKLHQLGVRTCGELGRFPVPVLKRRFGIIGERLVLMGRGVDSAPVVPQERQPAIKTVGHSMTLQENIDSREEIACFVLQLSEMVGRRARRYEVTGRTLILTLRYADFSTFSRQQTLGEAIHLSEQIYRAILKILDSLVLTQPVRLLGVRLSQLQHREHQLQLLPGERRRQLLATALDEVNNRHGEFALMSGRLLEVKGKGSRVISPAWRPEGIRNIDVG